MPIAKDAVNYGAQVELGAKSDESFNNQCQGRQGQSC